VFSAIEKKSFEQTENSAFQYLFFKTCQQRVQYTMPRLLPSWACGFKESVDLCSSSEDENIIIHSVTFRLQHLCSLQLPQALECCPLHLQSPYRSIVKVEKRSVFQEIVGVVY